MQGPYHDLLGRTNAGQRVLLPLPSGTHSNPTPIPSTFKEVLMTWGNTWLWEHVSITGGDTWIEESSADGMLVAVTDGLYIRELFPNV